MIILFFSAVGISLWLTDARMNYLTKTGKIPYGPLPNKSLDSYSFAGVGDAFDKSINLMRANEFTKSEFEELILYPLKDNDKEELRHHLTYILQTAVDYQIDPFWILAVMMAESGFDKNAKSNKDARGLMQIQPQTAGHLYQLMSKNISDSQLAKNLHSPNENIEVGIFYLKKLLQNFRLNYKYATIAYNFGPNKLKNLIEYDEIVPENVEYLSKVRESYKFFSNEYNRRLKEKDSLSEMLFEPSSIQSGKSPNSYNSLTTYLP